MHPALEPLFSPLPPARVLLEDDDVLVVDKPSGVSTQKGDASAQGDMIERARAYLRSRGGGEAPYVSAPVLLERDASGALLLLKKREHNAALVKALERGEVRARFVTLAPGSTAARNHPGVRLLGRDGDLALLELSPREPRASAARSLLASPAPPGRPGHGRPRPPPRREPPAERDEAPIHAERLSFTHPRTGQPVTVEAPRPPRLAPRARPAADAGLEQELERALLEAAQVRLGVARSGASTAFRLMHDSESPLPGVAVDLYDAWAVVHFSSPEAIAARDPVLDAVAKLGVLGVYAKFRPRQASTLVDTRRDDVAPAEPLRGKKAPDPLIVLEGGDRFVTRLGDGLSTGIFLDQRDNRAWVKAASRGKRVLNLFAYCCAFTVSAASGGASSTTSVDLSKQVLAWGEQNLRENGLFDPARHRFVADEALTFLRRCQARGEKFDLILLDPPSFATTKTTRFTAEHDYREVAAACLASLDQGGTLLACTNHRGIGWARFRRFLRDAAADARRHVGRLRELPPPLDFPVPPGGEPHLKTALLSVE